MYILQIRKSWERVNSHKTGIIIGGARVYSLRSRSALWICFTVFIYY